MNRTHAYVTKLLCVAAAVLVVAGLEPAFGAPMAPHMLEVKTAGSLVDGTYVGSDSTPTISVAVAVASGTVTLYSDPQCSAAISHPMEASDGLVVDVTVNTGLAAGLHTIYARHDMTHDSSECSTDGAAYQVVRQSGATYGVTFRGSFTGSALAPNVGVPGGAHFTTLVGGVHNQGVSFWERGGTASAGMEVMAETGGTGALRSEISAAGPDAPHIILESVPSGGVTRAVFEIAVDGGHASVTMASMVAPSPDWFIGITGLPLLEVDGSWADQKTIHLYPYDAGTENGNGFSLNNAATVPQGIITSIRDTGLFSGGPIATLQFELLGHDIWKDLAVWPVDAITESGVPAEQNVTNAVTTAYISGMTYALVAAGDEIRIINIGDPAAPVQVARYGINGSDVASGQLCQDCPTEGFGGVIAVAEIDGMTYALADRAEGVQIINMTDPTAPVLGVLLAGHLDGFMDMDEPTDIAIVFISNSTYALITTPGYGMHMVDIGDPTSPVYVGGLPYQDLVSTGMYGATHVDVARISGMVYALISHPAGMHIVDITDPAAFSVTANYTGGLTHTPGFQEVAVARISGMVYALISHPAGMHIVDITDPASPVQAAVIAGGFARLGDSYDIVTTHISGRTYALVSGTTPPQDGLEPYWSYGVQIVDITDPTSPVQAAWLTDGVDGFNLGHSTDIAIANVAGSSYALVTTGMGDIVQIIGMALTGPPS